MFKNTKLKDIIIKQVTQLVKWLSWNLFGKHEPIDVKDIPDLDTLLERHPYEFSAKQNGVPIGLKELKAMPEVMLAQKGIEIKLIGRPILVGGESRFIFEDGRYVERKSISGKWLAFGDITIGPSSRMDAPDKTRTAYDYINNFYKFGRLFACVGY